MTAFSISGFRVRVDPSWFIAFFLFTWTLSEGYFPFQAPNYTPAIYWIFGSVSTLALFASVLIHELSHCVVARRLGVEVLQITLFIFGGVSEMAQSDSKTPGSEFRITIAGPLSSLGLGLLFGGLSYGLSGFVGRIATETLWYLVYINVLLAAFNMIPGFPLDGGRILRSYLWRRTGNFGRATRQAARVGGVFAMVMMALGLAAMVATHLMLGIWMVLIGVFLKKSAETEYRSFHMRTTLENLKVSDVMGPPVAVKKGTTISELLNDYVFHYHDRSFPVVDRDRFIGMIDVREIKKVPADEWPNTYIDAFIADESKYVVLHPSLDAPEAIRRLVNHPTAKAPVLQGDILVGVLSPHDLVEVISVKSDLAA